MTLGNHYSDHLLIGAQCGSTVTFRNNSNNLWDIFVEHLTSQLFTEFIKKLLLYCFILYRNQYLKENAFFVGILTPCEISDFFLAPN